MPPEGSEWSEYEVGLEDGNTMNISRNKLLIINYTNNKCYRF